MNCIINEGQFNRLYGKLKELRMESITLDSKEKDFPGEEETRTTQPVLDKDEKNVMKCGPTTDKHASQITTHAWDFNRGKHVYGTSL